MTKKIFLLVFLSSLLVSCSIFKCKKKDMISQLDGTWELNYITGPRIAFDGLYPNKKPTIVFDTKENRISGNNSCNSYNGKLVRNANLIDFTQPMSVTKMMCINNQGEQIYMSTLQKITL